MIFRRFFFFWCIESYDAVLVRDETVLPLFHFECEDINSGRFLIFYNVDI